MLELPPEEVGQGIGRRVTQVLHIARHAGPKMRSGGTLLLTGGSQRNFDRAAGITPAAFAVLPPFTAQLALELAPVRVNLIQAGFVDTAPATSYFADERAVEARRDQLRARLPIGRVVGPADVAALAVHLMINTAVTGATYNIDGGQRLITRLRPPRPAIGRPPFERPARDIRSSARGLAADCGWRQSETRRTCALDVLRGTDAEMPTSHYADTRRTADGSAPYAGPARETRAGDVYVTDGVFLYRIVRVVAGAAADMVELEDCFLLDIVRIPLADLRARRLRVITPAGVRG